MELTTPVAMPKAEFKIPPCEKILFVGSCFADSIGRMCTADAFRTEVNPFGVMYNPASILHTVMRTDFVPNVVVLTLGTNHVYILNERGEIVDNCRKRPQSLFTERELSIEECQSYLSQTVMELMRRNADVKIIVTVSPIRYRKYGYHRSRLSKATLLLAADSTDGVSYFPAYEIMNDELRDYRFYQPDMLHPSQQAVEYIYQKFGETYFADDTFAFLREWEPLRKALAHRPFNPDSVEYRDFMNKTMLKVRALSKKYPTFAYNNEQSY